MTGINGPINDNYKTDIITIMMYSVKTSRYGNTRPITI